MLKTAIYVSYKACDIIIETLSINAWHVKSSILFFIYLTIEQLFFFFFFKLSDNFLSISSNPRQIAIYIRPCLIIFVRFRLLIAIRTEITDNVEMAPSEVEVEPTVPVNETAYARNEEFFLFATIMDATMIDKKLGDKPMYFEISIGNAGNALDGHNESFKVIRIRQNYDNESRNEKVAKNCKKPILFLDKKNQTYIYHALVADVRRGIEERDERRRRGRPAGDNCWILAEYHAVQQTDDAR